MKTPRLVVFGNRAELDPHIVKAIEETARYMAEAFTPENTAKILAQYKAGTIKQMSGINWNLQ